MELFKRLKMGNMTSSLRYQRRRYEKACHLVERLVNGSAGLDGGLKPRDTAGIRKWLGELFVGSPETGWLTEILTSALNNETGFGMLL
jgi:hypothetical protein